MLVVGWLAVAACTHDDAVDTKKCTKLRDHIVDLRLSDGDEVEGFDVAQHRAALTDALGDKFVADCANTMPIEQLRCEMKATDLRSASGCSARATR